MAKALKKLAAADWIWKWACLLSLPLGSLVFRENLKRVTDGDDGFLYYDGGMRAWSDVLANLFVPPADKPFLFGRHRPVIELIFKSVWSLGLSHDAINVLFWIFYWLSCVALGWGMKRVFALGVPMAAGAGWAMATVMFWAAPGMIILPTPVASSFIALFVGLALGLFAGIRPGRAAWARGGLAIVFAFLAYQLHESPWFFTFWLAAWLFGIRYIAGRKDVFPKFWWPLAFFAVYCVIYRSLSPSGNNRSDLQLAYDVGTLWKNGSYMLLTAFNGLSRPLFALTGETRPNLDVELSSIPWAFGLTLAALGIAYFLHSSAKPKNRLWIWGTVISWGVILVSSAPYWIIVSHRFIYFALLPATFLAVWFVAQVSRGGRVAFVPVTLLLAANIWTSCQAVYGFNWLKWNDGYVKNFHSQVMAIPELKTCSSEQPCCLQIAGREWGRNEWMLNWLSGAPKKPIFVPDNQPGFRCERTFRLN